MYNKIKMFLSYVNHEDLINKKDNDQNTALQLAINQEQKLTEIPCSAKKLIKNRLELLEVEAGKGTTPIIESNASSPVQNKTNQSPASETIDPTSSDVSIHEIREEAKPKDSNTPDSFNISFLYSMFQIADKDTTPIIESNTSSSVQNKANQSLTSEAIDPTPSNVSIHEISEEAKSEDPNTSYDSSYLDEIFQEDYESGGMAFTFLTHPSSEDEPSNLFDNYIQD